MTNRRPVVPFAVAVVAAACGGDHMDDDDLISLRASIGTARAEVTRHHEAVMRVDVLSGIPSEVDHHEREMSEVMTSMDWRMGGMMSHCTGPGMGMMHDMMNDMTSAMHAHRDALADAPTLADAQSACTAHTGEMTRMLDTMQQSLGNATCMGR